MKIKKLLDLSQTFYHNNPGFMPYELCEINYETLVPKDGYTSERIYMNTNSCTFMPISVSPIDAERELNT